jgi:hypothetical protein
VHTGSRGATYWSHSSGREINSTTRAG